MKRLTDTSHSESPSPGRRRALRWLGAASLALPAMLAGCVGTTPPRHYKRPPSHITGKDHRNGSPADPNRVFYIR